MSRGTSQIYSIFILLRIGWAAGWFFSVTLSSVSGVESQNEGPPAPSEMVTRTLQALDDTRTEIRQFALERLYDLRPFETADQKVIRKEIFPLLKEADLRLATMALYAAMGRDDDGAYHEQWLTILKDQQSPGSDFQEVGQYAIPLIDHTKLDDNEIELLWKAAGKTGTDVGVEALIAWGLIKTDPSEFDRLWNKILPWKDRYKTNVFSKLGDPGLNYLRSKYVGAEPALDEADKGWIIRALRENITAQLALVSDEDAKEERRETFRKRLEIMRLDEELDREPPYRAELIHLLSECGAFPANRESMEELLVSKDDRTALKALIRAIGRTKGGFDFLKDVEAEGSDPGQLFTNLLDSETYRPDIRHIAVRDAIASLAQGPNSVEALKCLRNGIIHQTKSELIDTKVAAIGALGSAGQWLEEVKQFLEATEPEIRGAAINAVATILGSEDIKELDRLKSKLRDEDADVVTAAIKALSVHPNFREAILKSVIEQREDVTVLQAGLNGLIGISKLKNEKDQVFLDTANLAFDKLSHNSLYQKAGELLMALLREKDADPNLALRIINRAAGAEEGAIGDVSSDEIRHQLRFLAHYVTDAGSEGSPTDTALSLLKWQKNPSDPSKSAVSKLRKALDAPELKGKTPILASKVEIFENAHDRTVPLILAVALGLILAVGGYIKVWRPIQNPIAMIFHAQGGEHLEHLADEASDIRSVLLPKSTLCDPELIPAISIKRVLQELEYPQHRNRLAILHYGGHADGEGVMLKGEGNSHQKAFIDGLAGSLKQFQKNLQLVFLNGCATEGQVKKLIDAEIPVVIATSAKIDDLKATQFAVSFYGSLARGESIAVAFESADNEYKSNEGSNYRAGFDSKYQEGADSEKAPWKITYRDPDDESQKNWTLKMAAEKMKRKAV